LILGHDAERVVDVVGTTIAGTYAVTVPSKVCCHDVESFCQLTGDFVPGGVCERVAVQQQERRAIPSMPEEDVGAARMNPSRFEAIE
jgi:hypothetical protein